MTTRKSVPVRVCDEPMIITLRMEPWQRIRLMKLRANDVSRIREKYCITINVPPMYDLEMKMINFIGSRQKVILAFDEFETIMCETLVPLCRCVLLAAEQNRSMDNVKEIISKFKPTKMKKKFRRIIPRRGFRYPTIFQTE